jgi:hypothetical protein
LLAIFTRLRAAAGLTMGVTSFIGMSDNKIRVHVIYYVTYIDAGLSWRPFCLQKRNCPYSRASPSALSTFYLINWASASDPSSTAPLPIAAFVALSFVLRAYSVQHKATSVLT